MSKTPVVVSATVGEVSVTTALSRSSWEPGTGTASGTAMNPACMAPRNATTNSSPCGATISARSPGAPCLLTSSAMFSVRR
jgi:hypothetical protein